MTQYETRSVVSGRTYEVVGPAAGEPVGLEDFVGDRAFLIDLEDGPYPVRGCGRRVGPEEVRFYQKDRDGYGRDVRTWLVRRTGDGRFSVEHVVR
jgi:hypothetical protein